MKLGDRLDHDLVKKFRKLNRKLKTIVIVEELRSLSKASLLHRIIA